MDDSGSDPRGTSMIFWPSQMDDSGSDTRVTSMIFWPSQIEYIPIPEYIPTFEEVSKQMRINVDILKQEITDHVDKEIERLKNSYLKEMTR